METGDFTSAHKVLGQMALCEADTLARKKVSLADL